MSSRKVGSPLAAIFQQWAALQKKQDHDQRRPSSYRIVVQTTSSSLRDRIASAEPVENAHIYARAKQPTPAERAGRDLMGSTPWLWRLMEVAMQATEDRVLYVITRPSSSSYSMSSPEWQGRIQVLDLATHDPWGWDEGKDRSSCRGCNLSDLGSILEGILQATMSVDQTPTMIVWQSLMPLMDHHGFTKMVRFLNALPRSLQIWPVQREGLTPCQHAQLEDMAHALLSLQGGDMTMIREGVRERGNILRQVLPFRLVQRTNVSLGADDEGAADVYRVVEGVVSDEEEMEQGISKRDGGTLSNVQPSERLGSQDNPSIPQRSRPRGIPLQLEDETRTGEAPPIKPSRGPKIYVQDDDPEFDDMDEEDPDDDLEI
jgi:hypothetical protein